MRGIELRRGRRSNNARIQPCRTHICRRDPAPRVASLCPDRDRYLDGQAAVGCAHANVSAKSNESKSTEEGGRTDLRRSRESRAKKKPARSSVLSNISFLSVSTLRTNSPQPQPNFRLRFRLPRQQLPERWFCLETLENSVWKWEVGERRRRNKRNQEGPRASRRKKG